ncbi:MAG: methenyltetrahydrofolate cyclohydrolase [Myxococcales bacterium]|nr:MAG: methenyltetrahydrofolate cyclohydrolase [Myxococcales bacterium]
MLADLSVRRFLDELAAKSATPGGGSAAALAGAMAASLAAMTAALTMGKKAYAAAEGEMRDVETHARPLAEKFLRLVDADAEAYAQVMTAFKLPKDKPDEIAVRTEAIRRATLLAAQAPLDTLRAAGETLELVAVAARLGNRNCASDAAVAGQLALAAAEGAYRNVTVNLDSLPAGDAEAAALRRQAERLIADCRIAGETLKSSTPR